MADKEKKVSSFNLIKKEVQLKEGIKVERDWYILFNFLVVCIIVCLSIISVLYRLSTQNKIDSQKAGLALKINSNLNTPAKSLLESRINVIEDKSAIYNEFLNQNFDVNSFYQDMTNLYPGVKIDKFTVQPTSNFLAVDLTLETNGKQITYLKSMKLNLSILP
jgi:hypothetical protein